MRKYLFVLVTGFISTGVVIAFSQMKDREHPYYVSSTCISPNGRYVAVGRLDMKLLVWDVQKKELVFNLEGKKGAEINLESTFTPDSKYFIFQDKTNDLIFVDLENQKPVKRYHIDSEFGDIAYFKDGNRFIWGGEDGRIEYVDMVKNEKKILKDPEPSVEFPIIAVAISPDEKRFLSSTEIWPGKAVHKLNLWDAVELKHIVKLIAPRYRMQAKCWPIFSPDSKKVLAVSENDWVCTWNAEDGTYVFESDRAHTKGIGYVDSVGKYFVTLSTGFKNLPLFESGKKEVIKELPLKDEPVFGQLKTLPSKNLIVTGDTDGSFSLYKFNPETLSIELLWHPRPVKSGLIHWISPLDLMDKTPEDEKKMNDEYIDAQKKMGFGKKDKAEK